MRKNSRFSLKEKMRKKFGEIGRMVRIEKERERESNGLNCQKQ